jgi:hypothetical protein
MPRRFRQVMLSRNSPIMHRRSPTPSRISRLPAQCLSQQTEIITQYPTPCTLSIHHCHHHNKSSNLSLYTLFIPVVKIPAGYWPGLYRLSQRHQGTSTRAGPQGDPEQAPVATAHQVASLIKTQWPNRTAGIRRAALS